MSDLAELAEAASPPGVLAPPGADPNTLEVSVSSGAQPFVSVTNWTFDPTWGAVVFDPGFEPADGDVVRLAGLTRNCL